MPIQSVHGRWDVRLLLHSAQHFLLGPLLQAGPSDVVAVVSAQTRFRSVHRVSHQLGVSDHDHLRGEVRVRFSAPPSDVADQNPHDGCHRLHYHSHDSGHLYELSSEGTDTIATVWTRPISFVISFFLNVCFSVYGK